MTTGHKDLTDGDDRVYVCVSTWCRLLEGTIINPGDLRPAPCGSRDESSHLFMFNHIMCRSAFLMSSRFIEEKRKTHTSKSGSRCVPYFFFSSPMAPLFLSVSLRDVFLRDEVKNDVARCCQRVFLSALRLACT